MYQLTALNIRPTPQYKPFSFRKFAYDFAYPEHNLLIDVQGGIHKRGKTAHSSGSGITDDSIKHNLATLSGYRVLIIVPQWIETGQALDFIQAALLEGGANKLALCPQQLRNRLSSIGLKRPVK